MPKKTGNAGHGLEAYDPKTGQYIKEGEESSKEDFSIDIIKGAKSLDLDDLFDDDDDGEDLDSWLERRNFWNNSEKRDPNWVCDNIEKFFDKEVVDFLTKYDFHTASSLGARTWSSQNLVLTNAIAFQMYQPMTPVSPEEFDSLLNQVGSDKFSSRTPSAPLAYIERGFSNKGVIAASYLRQEPSDLVLTQGAHGSCVYTAYNAFTASSYAGYGGYIMKAVIDNANSNTIDEQSVYNLKNTFLNRINEIKSKLYQHGLNIGLDDSQAQRLGQVFENTLQYDEMFPAVICGYDVVYDKYDKYALLLRFRNVKVKKDW